MYQHQRKEDDEHMKVNHAVPHYMQSTSIFLGAVVCTYVEIVN